MSPPGKSDAPVETSQLNPPAANSSAGNLDHALDQYRQDFSPRRSGKGVDFKAALSDQLLPQESSSGPSFSDKLSAEGRLLATIPSTIGPGIKASAIDTWDHLGRASFETITGLALGAGFCLLSKNPSPFIQAATTWAGRAFIGVAALDLGSRFARPMAEVWSDPQSMPRAKKALGENLGDAVFNYSLAIAGGIGGAQLGEKYLATTKVGEFLQGFKEVDVTAEQLGKIVIDPAKSADPLARVANAYSRRGVLDSGTGTTTTGNPSGGLSGGLADGAPELDKLAPGSKIRLRQMGDGSQIGSTKDGSVMVLTKDGTALWFKNNRSLFGLRNKLDLATVLHQGGDETDILTGMYSPTTMRTYGRGGPSSAVGKEGKFIGKDPSIYFDAQASAGEPVTKVPDGLGQGTFAKDGTRFETTAGGRIKAVEAGGNRVFLDPRGNWKMTMGGTSGLGGDILPPGSTTHGTDVLARSLDDGTFTLSNIPSKFEAAKKGAEVGMTEIMLERGGDIGSSLVEHEILVRGANSAQTAKPHHTKE